MRNLHVGLAVLVTAIWGFNFVVIEVGLDSFPPFLFSAIRFALAAFPLVFFIGPPRVAWRWVIAVGLTLGVIKFSFLFIGMDMGMPAGLSSVVLQSQAFFTVLFAAIILAERPHPMQVLGIMVAFGGIALIATTQEGVGSLTALALVVAAGAMWGVSNILMKMSNAPDMFRLLVWASIVPPLPLLALSYAFEGEARIVAAVEGMTWTGAGTVAYMAFISTLIAFGIWGFLLRTYSASFVAPFSLLVPIFGMGSAALLLDESFGPLRLAGAALVFAGLIATVFGPALARKMKRVGAPSA
ncbi:MAG: EamA family transporter [Alphaproteobacteria bacterium]|jgi:O-acetylserine/cysteine efflux transporter|nr:EamA family transporter [Alphaproteobacteria bacterium]